MQFESERHTRVLANVSAMEAATPVATPKTNSSGTKNSRPNFFLMAALQLMDVHHTTVLQPQGALLSGYLKKAKDAPIPLFTQKYNTLYVRTGPLIIQTTEVVHGAVMKPPNEFCWIHGSVPFDRGPVKSVGFNLSLVLR